MTGSRCTWSPPARTTTTLHDVLHGDLPLREKAALYAGLVSSRWTLGRILKSISPSASLLAEGLRVGIDTPGTDFLTPWPDMPDDHYEEDYLAQEHTTDLTLWRPRGILVNSPLGAPQIRRLVERMPHAYRLLPHQGQMIDKPVLRLILSTRLPELLWRRFGHVWPDSPHQKYLLTHSRVLAELLGDPDSHLLDMGVVDPGRLARVLAEPALLRRSRWEALEPGQALSHDDAPARELPVPR